MDQTIRDTRNKVLRQAGALVLASGLILFAGWGLAHETRAIRAYTPNNLMRQSQEAVPADRPVAISSDRVLRLHVRANSNSPSDQEVKVAVKDAIMARFGPKLADVADAEEAQKLLSEVLPDIEQVAVDCIKRSGFTYGARAKIAVGDFPDKEYTTAKNELVYLPAGRYKALIVDLGKGEGDNWWCVMYPPLCYFDLVHRTVLKYGGAGPDATEAASLVVDELSTKEVPVEVRSLLLDTLRSGVKKLAEFLARARIGPKWAKEAP